MDSRYHHATGLVLKHYTLGESDRRVIFLIPGLGKIAAKARGAKKLTSPFTSRLSPLNICQLLLYKTPANSWTVTQCQTQERFPELQTNLLKSSLALSMMDIVHRCTEEGHISDPTSDSLYRLTTQTLQTMNTLKDEVKAHLLFQTYQIQILDILGVLPSFSTCAKCHKKIDLETLEGWHPLELLCTTCSQAANHLAYDLFDNTYLKLLNFMRKSSIQEMLNIKLTPIQSKTMTQILLMLWKAQAFSIPKSIDALESLHA